MTVSVTECELPDVINIPVCQPDIANDNPFRSRIPISSMIYVGVFYASVEAADRRKGVTDVAYFLVPPDPWLVALGAVMWQGLVQGMTWDTMKLFVRTALKKLQRERVAPNSAKHQVTRQEMTELGFTWVAYVGEKKQYEMFLGLRKIFRHQLKPAQKAKKTKPRRKQ